MNIKKLRQYVDIYENENYDQCITCKRIFSKMLEFFGTAMCLYCAHEIANHAEYLIDAHEEDDSEL